MQKKILGITSVSLVILSVVILAVISFNGEFFRALNIQLFLTLFTASIVFSGMYLLQHFSPAVKKISRILISSFGGVILVFSVLTIFNIIDFLNSFNWLISGIILYLLLVQLNVLQWGEKTALIPKICSFALILSNLFLALFFIAKWSYSALSIWVNIAIAISMISFILGTITTKKVV